MATASVTNTFVNGTTADATDVNTNFTDLVTFLNNSVVHRDGSKAMTAALPMGSQKITGLADGTVATDAASKGQMDTALALKLDATATAVEATKLATARSIGLGGDLSGSANFDGSANVTITGTVANDSHTHDTRYFTESEADSRFVRQSRALLRRTTTDVVVPTATWTAIDWNSELEDTDSYHSTVTNPNRITIPATGVYLMGATARMENNGGTGYAGIHLENQSAVTLAEVNSNYTAADNFLTISVMAELSANDWVQVEVYQNQGGNRNFRVATIPYFWIQRVA